MLEKTLEFQKMCDRLGIKPIPESTSESEDEYNPRKVSGFVQGFRLGVTTIRNHARSTLANCDNEVAQADMKSRLQSATINLIRNERMLMETSKIVAGIVDDISEEVENEEDSLEGNLMPKMPSPEELLFTKEKLSGMLDLRMGTFKDTLTRASLETNPQYVLLQEQILLAEGDFERKQGKIVAYGGSDMETNGIDPNLESFVPIQYEDETDDLAVLPCKDPLTKKSMMNPIRNKICNHIFEHSSIHEFMDTNPGASCPGNLCLNKRPLEPSHFTKDRALVTKVREKILGVSSGPIRKF